MSSQEKVAVAESTLNMAAAHYRQAVHRFVLRLVRQQALADDLTQETFLRAQSAGSPCRDRTAKQGWLYSIALNVVRDYFRAQARAPQGGEANKSLVYQRAAEDVEHKVLQTEMSDCILEYLENVPSPQQEVLILHGIVGLGHAEISETLDISEANSRVLLHRARSLFRSVLERNCVLTFDDDPIPCERQSPRKS